MSPEYIIITSLWGNVPPAQNTTDTFSLNVVKNLLEIYEHQVKQNCCYVPMKVSDKEENSSFYERLHVVQERLPNARALITASPSI